jgi:hypothetical protein
MIEIRSQTRLNAIKLAPLEKPMKDEMIKSADKIDLKFSKILSNKLLIV